MSLYINDKTTGKINSISGQQRIDKELNIDSKNPVENKIITTKINELEENFAEIKKSVSDGKEMLAGAITSKGIETASIDSFNVMAENVRNIKGDGDIICKTNSTKGTFSDALYGIATTATSEIQEG